MWVRGCGKRYFNISFAVIRNGEREGIAEKGSKKEKKSWLPTKTGDLEVKRLKMALKMIRMMKLCQKKRRKVKGLGYMGDLYHVC